MDAFQAAATCVARKAIRRTRPPPAVVTGRPLTRLDREAVLRCGRGPDAVEELLVYRIVRVECKNDRIEIAECHSIDVFGRCNDEVISDLTSSRRRPIENAAARTAVAKDDVGANPRAGVLVPKLQRINARRLAVFRVQGDRAVII